MIVEQLEKSINRFLQQKISFIINGKTIKSGKLLLFCVKDFYLVFTLCVTQSKKVFEVPYPYSFSHQKDKIIFDYSTKTLCQDIEEIKHHAKLLAPKKPNKFFNSYVELAIVEEGI
jgi:hypothetical protein